MLYKSPYSPASEALVEVFYAPPRRMGQINPSQGLFPSSVTSFQHFDGWMKSLVPCLLHALNATLPKTHCVAQSAIEREMATIRELWPACKGNSMVLFEELSFTHTFSFLEYPVAYHVDVPKKGSRIDGDYSMMEYKFVFEESFLTGRYRTGDSNIARLRGGAGIGKAAFAVATHQKKKPGT